MALEYSLLLRRRLGPLRGCYAAVDGRPSLNDIIRTPNVDRVAREGVLFRNAFVNAPSCTPCRSSLLSGRYFFNAGRGAILQGAVWDDSIPSFPLLLRDAGYHIGKSYKVWSPGTPIDAPFGGQRHAYQKSGIEPNNFSERVTERVQGGMSLAMARDEILAQVRGFDAFLADRARPAVALFLWADHDSRTWIKGSGKALWGIGPTGSGPDAGVPADVRRCAKMADYLGESQAVDAYLGVLLERQSADGSSEPSSS